MRDRNPFESREKTQLREFAFVRHINKLRQEADRKLVYFGLPSAGMLDVKSWKSVIGHVFAIESDPHLAERMCRTAVQQGIRKTMTLLEMKLSDVLSFLGTEEHNISLKLDQYTRATQDKLLSLRRTAIDIVNLDLCGGFLYPDSNKESKHPQGLENLIYHQQKFSASFLLILTYQVRDTGAGDYDLFISETLDILGNFGLDTDCAREYYLSSESSDHPLHLRRMRFSIPSYVLKVAYDHFRVKMGRAYYYKNFYHAVFRMDPRKDQGALGTWPPVDELIELLHTPLIHLTSRGSSGIQKDELSGPAITY
jgi:hypothetical protein